MLNPISRIKKTTPKPTKEQCKEDLRVILNNTTIPDQPSILDKLVELVDNVDWQAFEDQGLVNSFKPANPKYIGELLEGDPKIHGVSHSRSIVSLSSDGVFVNTAVAVGANPEDVTLAQCVTFQHHNGKSYYIGTMIGSCDVLDIGNDRQRMWPKESVIGLTDEALKLFRFRPSGGVKEIQDQSVQTKLFRSIFDLSGTHAIYRTANLQHIRVLYKPLIKKIGEFSYYAIYGAGDMGKRPYQHIFN